MSAQVPGVDEKRLEYAKEQIREYGDRISPQIQADILAQIVTLGMSPYEARLAGGAFAFKVVADPKKWAKNSDPYAVMWAQSLSPDDSEIWMTFETATQYKGCGVKRFQVYFSKGVAVGIEKIERDGN